MTQSFETSLNPAATASIANVSMDKGISDPANLSETPVECGVLGFRSQKQIAPVIEQLQEKIAELI